MIKISILAFCCCMFLVAAAFAQPVPFAEGTKIFIVRHAEKDTGNNPGLSGSGRYRAGELYRLLKKEQIGKIYFSRYKRTRETADTLLYHIKADTFSYQADVSGGGLAEVLKITVTPTSNSNILVVGHSNTIPAIIRKLGVEGFTLKEIAESEYDNLFIITYRDGTAMLQQQKYGNPSAARPSKMMPLQ